MQFVSVRQMRQNSAALWEKLKKEKEVILTSNGKPIAILTGVNENNVEKYLAALRKAKALIAIEEMHRASSKAGTDKMTITEIETEIKQVRKERRR